MSLAEILDDLRATLIATPAGHRAYQSVVDLLDGSFIDQVLPVGAPIPKFVLPNAEGRLITSDELLERGPLVLNFFRGDWCPYCRAMLDALEAILPEIERAGATLLAVTPDTGGRPLVTKRNRKLHFEIAVDADNAVGLQFGVVFRLPEPYRTILAAKGTDLPTRHGNPGWLVPAPAVFLVGTDGIIRWRHVPSDPSRRAEPAEIVRAIREIRD